MNEEASAGEKVIQSRAAWARKGQADSKGGRKIKFSLPRSLEAPPPYDSKRMPARPIPPFLNYDTVSRAGGDKGRRSLMLPVNKLMVSALERVPKSLVKPVAMRYIAGEDLEDAVRVVQGLNARKMIATVDVLGENVSTEEESLQAVQAGQKVLGAIQKERLNANLSIKLTQFGVKIDGAFCRENVERILRTARSYSNFIRIDMEDSSLTSTTLNLYERLRGEGYENVGVVIQAYLRRSEEDVKNLIPSLANVRVVKGIYIEPETIAFKDREEIRRNYLKLLRMLLKAGCYVGIATHDDFLVQGAYEYIREMNLPGTAYEFQMLYGVRMKLRDQIVADGHRMRIYVPFGKQWHSYSIRRFKENPQIARYVLKALWVKG